MPEESNDQIEESAEAQQSVSTSTARNLATTTKTAPQMLGITPRWLLKLLPWVQVGAGTYRVNRRKMAHEEEAEVMSSDHGEKHIEHESGHEGEVHIPTTFADYTAQPSEYPLSIAQSILRVHTRVTDLYNDPIDQFREQLRLTIEELTEAEEREIINNEQFGLLNVAAPSMRIQTRSGSPTPDDLDELISRVWKQPAFFLAHPRAIAAFERECTARGVPPVAIDMFGSPVITWRGVPLIPSNKLMVDGDKTNILLMRVGEKEQGVVGLHQSGITAEHMPSLSVRFMGINSKAVASYLVTLYFSVAVLVDDALGVLENVEVSNYYEYKATPFAK